MYKVQFRFTNGDRVTFDNVVGYTTGDNFFRITLTDGQILNFNLNIVNYYSITEATNG